MADNNELQKLYELQNKLFTTSTENNPYLQNSTINPDLSKGLNTDSKTIIGAINDIFAITTAVKETNADFIDRFNRIIGNEELNPTLLKRLSAIGSNFYEVLFKTWDKAETNEDVVKTLEDQIEELKTQIEDLLSGGTGDGEVVNLKNQVESLQTQMETVITNTETITNKIETLNTKVENIVSSGAEIYFYEEDHFSGNTFTLAKDPLSIDAISIYINGIHYSNDLFGFSNDNKTITWMVDDFEISEASDCVTVKYSSYQS